MKKRLISLLLILTMMLPMIPVLEVGASSDLAIEDLVAGSETSSVSVVLEETWGSPTQTVDLNLTIANNPGILGATLTISWDESLTLVSDKSGEAFDNMTYQAPSRYIASGTNFVWFGNEVGKVSDGIILTLSFKISENVKNNDILPIKVTYVHGDVIDGNDNDVSLDITDGSVRVITYLPGDVTGDGHVNSRDLVRLSQYISDGCKTDSEGYNAVVVEDACDVTGDGKVNARDLIKLSQYISDGCKTDPDGYNSVLKPAKMPECEHFDMQKTEAKKATCTESGNIAYWYCPTCCKYFSDANGNSEVTLNETKIVAKGHTEIIDEAISPTYSIVGKTEGSHCSECGKIIIEQKEIPKLESTSHSISYRNLKNSEIPIEKMQYAEHEGMLELPTPIAEGYRFLGWYTKSVGGDLIDYISVEDTTDYVLFAHWELITYTITYQEAPINKNVTMYTIEDRIILSAPEWSGLMFVNWTDENGNVVSIIDKGTTGDIVLTANWKLYRNNVVAAKDSKLAYAFRNEMGLYYFVYKLGTIENVVISSITDSYTKTTSLNRKLTLEKTIETSETDMSSLATIINNSVTSTKGWSDTLSWAKTHSNVKNFTNVLSFSAEGGKKDTWKIGINESAQFGVTWGDTSTSSGTTVTSTTDSQTLGSSINTSSTVSYEKSMSLTESTSMEIDGELPNGLYEYVYTTNVNVYGVVIYDANEKDYCVGTYSTLGNLSTTMMYYKQPSDKDNCSCEGLSFDVSKMDDIENIINSSYYVKYDANGGDGEMLRSMHKVGESSTLQSNQFTRVGYSFAGWGLAPNGCVAYVDEAPVKDITEKGSSVTLYAIWSANNYKLTYHTENDYGLSAIIALKDQEVTFDQDYSLQVPQYQYSDYYDFVGWYKSTGERLTDENGSSLNHWNIAADCDIYAKWKKKYEDYVYINSRDGLESISDRPNSKYMIIDDIDLYSKDWIPLKILYGELDGQNHTISGMTINGSYEECGLFAASDGATICNLNLKYVSISNTFEKTNYTGSIVGSATKTTIANCSVEGQIESGLSSAKDESINTYANKLVGRDVEWSCTFNSNNVQNLSITSRAYIRTSKDYTITDSGRWNQNFDTIDLTKFGINTENMQDSATESITVTIWLDNKDKYRGNHFLFIYDMNDNYLTEYEFWAPDSGWGTATHTYEIGLQSIVDNKFKILYGASGEWDDDWYCGTLKLQLSF